MGFFFINISRILILCERGVWVPISTTGCRFLPLGDDFYHWATISTTGRRFLPCKQVAANFAENKGVTVSPALLTHTVLGWVGPSAPLAASRHTIRAPPSCGFRNPFGQVCASPLPASSSRPTAPTSGLVILYPPNHRTDSTHVYCGVVVLSPPPSAFTGRCRFPLLVEA